MEEKGKREKEKGKSREQQRKRGGEGEESGHSSGYFFRRVMETVGLLGIVQAGLNCLPCGRRAMMKPRGQQQVGCENQKLDSTSPGKSFNLSMP